MKLNLLSCDAQRSDRRALAKCIEEISLNVSEYISKELIDILLEGDPIEIEIDHKNSGSALRSLRKSNIDYDVIE